MPSDIRIPFSEMGWTNVEPGLRSKERAHGTLRVRIVEMTPEFVHPEWCSKAHAGYVIQGGLQLCLPNRDIEYAEGDVFLIPSGTHTRHIPRAKSPITILLLFDTIDQKWPGRAFWDDAFDRLEEVVSRKE